MTEEERARLAELDSMAGGNTATAEAPMTAQDRSRLDELNAIAGGETVLSGEEPDWIDKTRHVVGGGLTDFATGMLDAPYNIRKLMETGASKLTGDEVDLTMPEVFNYLAPTSLINTKFSERPIVSDIVEVTGKEMVNSDEYPGVDASRTAVEWGAGLPFAAARGVSMAPDILMALGAGGGDYIQNLFDSDGVFGEIAGGITGLIAALRRGRIPGGTKAEEKARKFIEANIQDPDETLKALEAYTAQGGKEAGTLADITGDRGIYNVETGVATDPTFKSAVDDIGVERGEQIAGEVRAPFGEGIPQNADVAATQAIETANANVAKRTDRLEVAQDVAIEQGETAAKVARAENQAGLDRAKLQEAQGRVAADEAEGLAQAAGREVGTTQRPAQISRELYDVFRESKKEVKAAANAVWEKFKAQPQVDTVPIGQRAGAVVNDMGLSKGIKTELNTVYGDFLRKFDKLGTAAGGDIHLWKRKVQNKLDQRYEAGDWNDADDAMAKYLEQVDEGLTATNPIYAEAKAATKDLKDRFTRGQSGKALESAEPEQFLGSAGGFVDEGGAVLARKLLKEAKVPGAEAGVIQALKAAGQRYGLDASFMNQYGDVFDALPPTVRRDFQAAVDAGDTAATAATTAEGLTKATTKAETAALKANEKVGKGETALIKAAGKAKDAARSQAKGLRKTIAGTWLAQYGKNPKLAFDKLLKPGNGKALGELYQSMVKRGEGDSFKAALGERIRKSLTVGSDTKTSVLPSSRGGFEKIREVLEDSGILSQAEIDDIAKSLEKTESINLRGKSWAEQTNKLENELDNLLASGAAAVALQAMPGSSLVLAGAVRRLVKKVIPSLSGGNKKEMAALEEFLKNPEAYFSAAKGATSPEQAVSRILTKVVGASLAAQAMNEE